MTESYQTSPILGLPTIQKLKLLTRISLVNKKDTGLTQLLIENKEIFEGIGKVPYEYDFKLKEGTVGM